MKLAITFFFSFLIVVTSTHGKDIYVSEKGNDKNKGTLLSPFASLYRAQMEARKFKTQQINIFLRKGTYDLSQPIIFISDDSRAQGKGLVIQAYQQEKVYIKGSCKLKLNWAQKDGVYQAKVPQPGLIFDQLYVNGVLMQMARYPNYQQGKMPFNGTAADVISHEHIQKWKNPEGAYLHVMQTSMWGGFAYRIKGKGGSELEMEGGWQNNRPSAMHKQYRFIENVFEELDTLNEWYFDKHNQQLYLKTNRDLSTALIETPQLESLLEIKGSAEKPVENISIKGLIFNHALRTFMKNSEPLLRSDWTIYRKGAITIEGAKHINIEKCVFNELGGNVLVYSNYNKQHTFSGNHIYNSGGNAVVFVGDPKAVRSPVFQYNKFVELKDIDMQSGPIGNNFPSECTIYDNLIHDIGQVEKQTAGVQISMAQNIKVSHNTIYNVPRAGINVNEGTWGGHNIEYNDVFNTVLETGDHGAFNSWGRDRFWHPKRVVMDSLAASHPELIFLDAMKPTVLFNNRFRCDHGWDIDLDDGSSNYIIKNNVCLAGGLKLREGFKRVVENNIMINNSFHPHVWFKNSNDVFKHNIVSTVYFPIQIKDWGKQVDDNLFPDAASLKKAQAWGTDANSVFGDAQFVNAGRGDYRVKAGSKAFSVGFKNFEMNFGVVSQDLITKAKKVAIPKLVSLVWKEDAIYDFAGVKVKNLTTLAERSATGMSAETGVLVIQIDQGSLMYNVLKPNDVILQMANLPVLTVKDLIVARQFSQSKNMVKLKLFRDQREQEVTVNLK
ncbi:MAG: PDZ domain-containing protein [Candidatus Pedobacter colombiensis]|uniref:PDZ domain-containing protein n=1 Tax=Candidatus Pedobacter colombiensis TaxID=3121371 RepID=A0AAJ6B5P0_9SPHI|nr:PDZ domain-containing protein [Pedobacter sp.]WEK17686.1 MAG: PDZ domain-containing protein [Pedobacter sp.]